MPLFVRSLPKGLPIQPPLQRRPAVETLAFFLGSARVGGIGPVQIAVHCSSPPDSKRHADTFPDLSAGVAGGGTWRCAVYSSFVDAQPRAAGVSTPDRCRPTREGRRSARPGPGRIRHRPRTPDPAPHLPGMSGRTSRSRQQAARGSLRGAAKGWRDCFARGGNGGVLRF